MSLSDPTSNAEMLRPKRPWSQVVPGPVRSLGRPLLLKWRHFYGVSKGKLHEKLASPGVTSYLTGGCANQIFQYAAGLALARRLGVDLKLDISWYETATPNMPRQYSLGLFKGVQEPVVRNLTGLIIREAKLPYNPALFQNVPRKCSLVGYWQCEKYFCELRDELSERLLPREPLPAWSIDTERDILRAGQRSVSIHVRRTDYVGDSYHLVLAMEYYREAVALMAAKLSVPELFVFSDDPQWCEANFKLPYSTTIVRNSDRRDGRQLGREDADLYLMRRCAHAITANSSFSWWGAWLGADVRGGTVIAPSNWFAPPFEADARDIVPDRWIKL